MLMMMQCCIWCNIDIILRNTTASYTNEQQHKGMNKEYISKNKLNYIILLRLSWLHCCITILRSQSKYHSEWNIKRHLVHYSDQRNKRTPLLTPPHLSSWPHWARKLFINQTLVIKFSTWLGLVSEGKQQMVKVLPLNGQFNLLKLPLTCTCSTNALNGYSENSQMSLPSSI